jgi:hypothetical protein
MLGLGSRREMHMALKAYGDKRDVATTPAPLPRTDRNFGSVLKVEMVVWRRGFTAFKTVACGLSQVAYLHI